MDKDFLQSLDVEDRDILPFLPYLLQDLWLLGSMPDYMLQLIQKHNVVRPDYHILDLGCGKGAALIYLREALSFQGKGIDLMPEFINDACHYVQNHKLDQNLAFTVGDIRQEVKTQSGYDLLIYGHDADVLGDVATSLILLQNCIHERAHILLEATYRDKQSKLSTYPTQKELEEQLKQSGLQLIDQIIWDRDKLRLINLKNTTNIEKRVAELIPQYPGKASLFDVFLEQQKEECQQLEQELYCISLLLKK